MQESLNNRDSDYYKHLYQYSIDFVAVFPLFHLMYNVWKQNGIFVLTFSLAVFHFI